MSITKITIHCDCDGCGKGMQAEMDRTRKTCGEVPDVDALAIDTIRGGVVYPARGATFKAGVFSSVYFDHLLCPECTVIADAMDPDPKTWDEIKELL